MNIERPERLLKMSSPWTQDVNVRRYVRSIYVLCPGGCTFNIRFVPGGGLLKAFNSLQKFASNIKKIE